MSVLVVGGANLDVCARSRAPLVPATSNPGTTVRSPGGVARNVAENLARLGVPVRLLLAVGDDAAGREVLDRTQLAGVETIEVAWAGPTGTYTAVLDHDGALVAGVADMAATEAIGPEHLDPRWVADATWLVLDGNLRPETLARGLALAEEAGVPVVLDPVSGPKAAALGPLVRRTQLHTVTPTLDELAALTGEPNPSAAVAGLLAGGVRVVWLRRGVDGSTLHRRGADPLTVARPPVTAVDVTGAGDAMLAAYVAALLRGADLARAALEGAAAASLTVRSPSSVRPDLSPALIEEELA